MQRKPTASVQHSVYLSSGRSVQRLLSSLDVLFIYTSCTFLMSWFGYSFLCVIPSYFGWVTDLI